MKISNLIVGVLLATCVLGPAAAQITQAVGRPPATTNLLDFESASVSVGPITSTDPTFIGAGIASVELTGSWIPRGDTLTAGANVHGRVLISQSGVMSIGVVGDELDDPVPLAELVVRLAAPASAFGVLFSDQINFDYRVELRSAGTSLGNEEFTYVHPSGGSFPAPPHHWTASGAFFDEVRIQFHELVTGTGFDEFAWVTIGQEIGTRHCTPAVVNSSGQPGHIVVRGSSIVADNSVELVASSLPTNTFGYFLTGPARAVIAQPGGSDGVLCVGGSIGRYVGPGQLRNSGASGEYALIADLTEHPTPTGLRPLAAGETWSFTSWFRDASAGMTSSNFTDAVEVVFQ